jgi:hypothetical protein
MAELSRNPVPVAESRNVLREGFWDNAPPEGRLHPDEQERLDRRNPALATQKRGVVASDVRSTHADWSRTAKRTRGDGRATCGSVGCITSPVNKGSIAFHRAMGFSLKESDTEIDGVPVHRNYDGPDRDRVVFEKMLCS